MNKIFRGQFTTAEEQIGTVKLKISSSGEFAIDALQTIAKQFRKNKIYLCKELIKILTQISERNMTVKFYKISFKFWLK